MHLRTFKNNIENKDDEQMEVDETSMEEFAAGVASTIYKARLKGDTSRVIAIKSAASKKKFSPEPHDIVKEIGLLKYLRRSPHENIIGYVGSRCTNISIELWTSWLPYGLEDLLDNPRFTVTPIPARIRHLFPFASEETVEHCSPSWKDVFKIICKSIVFQIISGLAHLHELHPPIGLRDVKPKNLLMKKDGTVKIVDFGIAFQEEICAEISNLWPEHKNKMYCDVATGPFRAPELLFGATTYDACATDLWSLGCTIAHFYTPLRLSCRSYLDEGDEDEGEGSKWREDAAPDPFLLPKSTDSIDLQSAEWVRESLFDGNMGSIGLAWSTFTLRGTPNDTNWPDFKLLPDATKIEFKQVPTMELRTHLPNLPAEVGPTSSEHKPPQEMAATPLDLIHRLLVYPPEARLRAADALRHPWFVGEGDAIVPVLLPNRRGNTRHSSDKAVVGEISKWKGKPLSHWLDVALKRR